MQDFFKKIGILGIIGAIALSHFYPLSVSAVSTNVAIEAWGAGGEGGFGRGVGNPACGGGGGAYSKLNALAVTSEVGYTVTVGVGGDSASGTSRNGVAGTDSWFSTSGTVLAKGGAGGTFSSGAANSSVGGDAASGIGDTKYSGGGALSGVFFGTGGGGAAGRSGNGGDAAASNYSSGGSAGSGGGAGSGGNGSSSSSGNSGNVYGGGGGGNSQWGANGSGGAGANGAVIVIAPLGAITSATGGTHTSDATYDYWTFTSSGTWTPTISSSVSVAIDNVIITGEW